MLMFALTPFHEAATADLYPAGRPGASHDPLLHDGGI